MTVESTDHDAPAARLHWAGGLPNDLGAALERRAALTPGRELGRFIESGRRLSFAEANALANRCAHGLRERGLGREDSVAIMLPNVPEMLVAQFGAYKAGVLAVIVNSAFRGTALARMINLAASPVLVTDARYRPVIDRIASELTSVRHVFFVGDDTPPEGAGAALPFAELLSERDHDPDRDLRPASAAAIMFTSGTTGVSKGCVLSHRYGLTIAQGTVRALRLTPQDVMYTPYPLCHQTAFFHETMPSVLTGGRTVYRDRFTASGFLSDVREHGGTRFCLMGTVAKILEKLPPRADDHENPLGILWGGPLPSDPQKFSARFGVRLTGCYGSTDAGAVAFGDVDDPHEPPGTQGFVQDIYEVRIADEHDEPLPPGATGEILVRGRIPHVMADGYYGMPEATAAASRDLWFHSGDLGRLDAVGRLYFLGRRKEMIRRGGENVSIFEVEEVLEGHPAVAEAAVIGVPSEMGEEEVFAAVRLADGERLDERALRSFCEQNMARFMVPKFIAFVAEIPRTRTGKVAIGELGEAVRNAASSAGSPAS